jgi:uncharacterized protein (DUF952 family)
MPERRMVIARDPNKMAAKPAPALIFKICSVEEWTTALAVGVYRGSADDQRDGYIHFSTAAQATETARKYFSNRRDLLLIAFDAAELGTQLRWEPSRGGALFPHLYADLPTAKAAGTCQLKLGGDGAPDVAAALRQLAAVGPKGTL